MKQDYKDLKMPHVARRELLQSVCEAVTWGIVLILMFALCAVVA